MTLMVLNRQGFFMKALFHLGIRITAYAMLMITTEA